MSRNARSSKLLSVAGAIVLTAVAVPLQLSASASAAINGALYFRTIIGTPPAVTKALNIDGTDASTNRAYAALGAVPSFNADGTKMAWSEYAGTSTVKIANSDGTNTVTLVSGVSSMLRGLQFSPDGTKLYFYASQGTGTTTIYSIDTATANQSITGKDVFIYSGNAADISISKNGKAAIIGTAACSGNPGSGYGVVLQDISSSTSGTTGSGTFLTGSASCNQNGATTTSPSRVEWSADGTKLYVAQVDISTSNSARTNLRINEFNEQGQIGSTFYSHASSAKEMYEISMSPDGTKIAFYVVNRVPNNPETPDALYVLDLSTKQASLVKTMTSDAVDLVWGPTLGSSAATTTTLAPTTTTVAPTPTTVAPAQVKVVPGVTVTDSNVYAKAPAKVAASSAITVLTPAQEQTSDIVTRTPSVCLPANDDLVFIDTGRCVAQVVSEKTGKVLRTLRTRVVSDEVSEVKVGNEVVTLAPIFFSNGSSDLSVAAKRRIRAIKDQVSAAGTVLIVGHSGIMLGDTAENRALSNARAKAVVAGLRNVKAQGPFYATPVGAADPAINSTDPDQQSKNRRVEIVLVP